MNQILKDGEAFRNGEIVKWDGDEIIADRQRLIVPMTMMDAFRPSTPSAPIFNADHARPRTMPLTDEQKARSLATHRKYQDRISDAWRKQPPTPQQRDNAGLAGLHLAKPESPEALEAYDRMRERLESRWKNPKTIA